MAELPRMPVDVAKLLADITYMSTEEKGAYCCILLTMWLHGGRLRDDERELARIAGVSLRRWRTIAERVTRPLTFAGGEVSQKRLTATWLDVQTLRKKHQAGATKRWLGQLRAEHKAQHLHTKDSNIDSSDSEDGTTRARDAAAPQGPPRAGSWQPEQNNRRKR